MISKTTELISELQKLVALHGDLPPYVLSAEGGFGRIDTVKVDEYTPGSPDTTVKIILLEY